MQQVAINCLLPVSNNLAFVLEELNSNDRLLFGVKSLAALF